MSNLNVNNQKNLFESYFGNNFLSTFGSHNQQPISTKFNYPQNSKVNFDLGYSSKLSYFERFVDKTFDSLIGIRNQVSNFFNSFSGEASRTQIMDSTKFTIDSGTTRNAMHPLLMNQLVNPNSKIAFSEKNFKAVTWAYPFKKFWNAVKIGEKVGNTFDAITGINGVIKGLEIDRISNNKLMSNTLFGTSKSVLKISVNQLIASSLAGGLSSGFAAGSIVAGLPAALSIGGAVALGAGAMYLSGKLVDAFANYFSPSAEMKKY